MSKLTRLFCIGTGYTSSNKKITGFIKVDLDYTFIGGELYYSSKLCRNCYVGSIYHVAMGENNGSSFITEGFTFEEVHPDKDVIVEYRARSEARETEANAIKQSKKAAADKTDIMSLLKPIRKAWHDTNTVGRIAIEARALYYIRHGKDL